MDPCISFFTALKEKKGSDPIFTHNLERLYFFQPLLVPLLNLKGSVEFFFAPFDHILNPPAGSQIHPQQSVRNGYRICRPP